MIKITRIITLLLVSFILINCKKSKNNPNELTILQKAPEAKLALVTSFKNWKQNPVPLISAHRGGPYKGFPENAIETFDNVVKHTPVVIECDVAMTKDSVLVLMHDKKLDRTTTGSGNVNDVSFNEIKNIKLKDNEGNLTSYSIPTLDAILAWGKHKVLFTLDVKRGVPFEKVISAIEKHSATDYAAVITYRIQDAILVHELNSNITISVSAGSEGAIEQIIKSEIPTNKLLGFVGTREPDTSHYNKLASMGIKTILGTLGNLDRSAIAKGNDEVYMKYIENGANIIATDRPLEVAKVLTEKTNLKPNKKD
ncbi:glycerophosphodiester phosphodiesterase family protein [Tenacibaculum geojense]|uniref:Glycerophosphodiester phosphodiesterase family protein n=1 Tax=Tenacibaculum geojense TaxID=915352 RepID=A0ABW3JUP5_9FLAO